MRKQRIANATYDVVYQKKREEEVEVKCPFCDGDCEKCAFKTIGEIEEGESAEEDTERAREAILKKEFGRDLYEWTMLDGRII